MSNETEITMRACYDLGNLSSDIGGIGVFVLGFFMHLATPFAESNLFAIISNRAYKNPISIFSDLNKSWFKKTIEKKIYDY
jgi:hypothetical protein